MHRKQSLLQFVRRLSRPQMLFLATAGSAVMTCSSFAGSAVGKNEVQAESGESIGSFERKIADLQKSLDGEKERVTRFSQANRKLSNEAEALREKIDALMNRLHGTQQTPQ
ncbi:MAG: hypothetical protein AAAB35_19690 [Phyllobacterium sp.]|uniref:hypothetical protein n=1 Tax=Phyllobacterium sp. TaxID=1871046 RepID=UPI0030F1BD6D